MQRVYGVVTDPDDLTDLRALILRAGFRDQVKLFSEPISEDSVNTAVFDPAQIAETFVLSVDTDEFAVLPVGESLQSFTASEPLADFFQMVWRYAPSDTMGEQFTPRIGILCKNYGKPMFRTRRFQKFNNTPHFIFCEPPKELEEEGMMGMQMYSMDERNCRRAQKSLALMHFWYRGVYDALLRQSAGHTTGDFSDRNTGVEVVLDELRHGILPQRLKHLAVGTVCEDLLETTTNSERSKFREIYGEDNTSFRLEVFINQTEAIDQLDFLGIDEELRMRAVEKYHQFKAAFAKHFEKIVCEPLKFCTVPITPSMLLAKSLTVEGMQNFDEPCKFFSSRISITALETLGSSIWLPDSECKSGIGVLNFPLKSRQKVTRRCQNVSSFSHSVWVYRSLFPHLWHCRSFEVQTTSDRHLEWGN